MSINALKEKFNSLTLESEDHWDYRGNSNSERDFVHGFCTYPAMMVPKMQREMLDVCLEHLHDMINTLFSMHNIKYIISVDDCFFAQKREDMEAIVYSQMCTSLEPFRAILSSCGQIGVIDEIDEMLDVGVDSTVLIQSLLQSLEDADLLKCYEVCEKSRATYAGERDSILDFLERLKSEGQITEYRTFPSTEEANQFDIHKAGMTEL